MILRDFQRVSCFIMFLAEFLGKCWEFHEIHAGMPLRYIKMDSYFNIVTQTQVGAWEKFQVVLVEHPLKQFIGQTIGLYNIEWFRFLRMRGSGAGEVDGSPESRTREVMPKDWYDCKFTVVDAGNNKAHSGPFS